MERKEEHKGSAPAWRKRLVIVVIFLIVSSIAVRVAMGSPSKKATETQASSRTGGDNEAGLPTSNLNPGGTTDLVPDVKGAKPPVDDQIEESTTRKVLPFVTEGGIAMLLGLALGIASRAFAKIALIGVALVFVAIQYLAYKGMLTVDWGAMGVWIKNFVLNISGDNGIGKIVQHKLPSAGSMGMGYYLGLKRGD